MIVGTNLWSARVILCSYEKDFTYETFAAALVRDLDLPDCFYKRIAKSIQEQVEKAQRLFPWHEAVTSESLHPIYINLRLNDTIYIDRFEWDLNDSNNSPEQFARVLCEDLVSPVALLNVT